MRQTSSVTRRRLYNGRARVRNCPTLENACRVVMQRAGKKFYVRALYAARVVQVMVGITSTCYATFDTRHYAVHTPDIKRLLQLERRQVKIRRCQRYASMPTSQVLSACRDDAALLKRSTTKHHGAHAAREVVRAMPDRRAGTLPLACPPCLMRCLGCHLPLSRPARRRCQPFHTSSSGV